jgi:hypothetical protein
MRPIAALWMLLAQDTQAQEVECTLQAFRAAYGSAEAEADRAAAVRALGDVRHPRVLRRLAPLLVSDGPTVRVAAAEAVARFDAQARDAAALLRGALPPNAKDPEVQVALVRALGTLRDAGSLPALHALMDHRSLPVARAAVEAVGRAGRKDSVDPLIALLARCEKSRGRDGAGRVAVGVGGRPALVLEEVEEPALTRARTLAPAACEALTAITKQNLRTARDWQAWRSRAR